MIYSLIHVPSSSCRRRAGPDHVSNRVLTRTEGAPASVRASRERNVKVSSGMTPRGSGENHRISPDSIAIGYFR